MCGRTFFKSILVVLCAGLGPQSLRGAHNPEGWIQMSGWNMLLPLVQDHACSGGGPENMLENWVAPHSVATEDPKAGDLWMLDEKAKVRSVSQGGFAPGGSANTDPLSGYWVSRDFLLQTLEEAFPDGDLVDFQGFVDWFNADVVPDSLFGPMPGDGVLGIATTYVVNKQAAALEVEICTASDDSIQVWVNNKPITNVSACRGAAAGCEETRLALLPPGTSRIAVLVWEGYGGWSFRLRIQDSPGFPYTDADTSVLEAVGPGKKGTVGQLEQTRVNREAAETPFHEPHKAPASVTLKGTAGSLLSTVVETISAENPESLEISRVAQQGLIEDLALPQPGVPLGAFDARMVVGKACGDASKSFYETASGTYESRAQTGGDIWDCGDVFEFAFSRFDGDFDVSIKFLDRSIDTSQGRWGKFGLMARQALATDSRFTMVQDHLPDQPGMVPVPDRPRVAGRTVRFGCGGMYEDEASFASLPPHPPYFRLTRRGNVVQGWASWNDSVENNPGADSLWTPGFADDWGPRAPAKIFVGFASSVHNTSGCATQRIRFRNLRFSGAEAAPVLGKTITWSRVSPDVLQRGLTYAVRYDDQGIVSFQGRAGTTAVTGAAELRFDNQQGPVGAFQNHHDVGNPGAPGSLTYKAATGSYTLTAAGDDIWQAGDQFHFAYVPIAGDFLIEARITDRQMPVEGGRWGKHGLMVRWSADPDASFSMFQMHTATHPAEVDEPRYAYRLFNRVAGSTREEYVVQDGNLGTRLPKWVRIVRLGNAIYGFASGQDPPSYCVVGSNTFDTMSGSVPDTLLVGMAASAHAGIHTTSITFDSVKVVRSGLARLAADLLEGQHCSRGDLIESVDFDGAGDANLFFRYAGTDLPGVVGGRMRLAEESQAPQAKAIWRHFEGHDLAQLGFVAEFDVLVKRQGVAQGADAADGFTFAALAPNWVDIADPPPFNLLGDTDGMLGYESGALKSQLTCKPNFAVELDVFVDGEGVESCPLPADNVEAAPEPLPGEIFNEPQGSGSPDNDGKYHVGVDVNFAVSSVQTDAQYACNAGTEDPALPEVFDPNGVKGAHFEIHYVPDDCGGGDPGCISATVVVYLSKTGGSCHRREVLRKEIMGLGSQLQSDVLLGFTSSTRTSARSTIEIDDFNVYELCCDPITCLEASGWQVAGDTNNDCSFNISDPIALLGYLFTGVLKKLPCGDGTQADPANVALLDVNGDCIINISDPVWMLNFLFLGGPAPVQGKGQVRMQIIGCPDSCAP